MRLCDDFLLSYCLSSKTGQVDKAHLLFKAENNDCRNQENLLFTFFIRSLQNFESVTYVCILVIPEKVWGITKGVERMRRTFGIPLLA